MKGEIDSLPPLPEPGTIPAQCKIAIYHLHTASRYISRATAALAAAFPKDQQHPSITTTAAASDLAAAIKAADRLASHVKGLVAVIDASAKKHVATAAVSRPAQPAATLPPPPPPQAQDLPPPPAVLRSEPDGSSIAFAVNQVRSTVTKDVPKILQPLVAPPCTACVPVIVDELAADPIPHAPCLELGGREAPSEEPPPQSEQQGTADASEKKLSLVATAEEQGQAKHPRAPITRARSSAALSPMPSPRRPDSARGGARGGLGGEPLQVSMKEVKPAAGAAATKAVSMLTMLLASTATPRDQRRTKYRVHLPPDYSASVVVDMNEAATVLDVIGEVLRTYNRGDQQQEAAAVVILKDDPRAYLLYTADDRGLPETDFPAPEESRKVSDLQSPTFALFDNPEYEVPVIMKVWTRGVVGAAEVPSGFVVLPYRADVTSKDILREVCRKARLVPTDYELQLTNLDVPFAPDVTIGELGVTELRVVRKKTRDSSQSGADLEGHLPRNLTKIFGPTFFFTAETARELKQYPVAHVSKKKFGHKRVRLMTIDGERITVTSPPDSKAEEPAFPIRKFTLLGSSSKSSKIKQPIRIADVVKVGVVSGKPNTFFIKAGIHTHEFESSHHTEIVAQLTCLLQNLGKV